MKARATKNLKGNHNRSPVTTIYQPFSWNDFETAVLDTDEDVVMRHPGRETDLLDTDEDVVMLNRNAAKNETEVQYNIKKSTDHRERRKSPFQF
jgi:hypothetical protein